MLAALRRYLIAGILVWLPLGVTVLVVKLFVDLSDKVMVLVPPAYHPEALLHVPIPGIGVLISILIIFFTGVIAANIFGRRLVAAWESLLARIPLVRSVYSAVKQLTETLFSPSGQSFRKVLLVEYPRRGLWTLAFQTGTDVGEAQEKVGREVINVYVPTTPNPTSGFFLIVPREDVVELDMSVDAGLKMIISMGVVVPGTEKLPADVAQTRVSS
ncbi:MAG: DUF502 domain-containing protein [Gammaproteobacteria bacterium]